MRPAGSSEEVSLAGVPIPCTNSFEYFGSTIEATGGCGADVDNRVRSAWYSWRGLSGVICDKKVPVKLKNKLYKTVIRPTLIYGSECWALHRAEQQRMHTTEMKMLRWIQGKTRKDRIRNEKFRSEAMVKPITTETTFVVWACDEKRRHKRCQACNDNEGGREETSRKAQTDVDGPSAERFETTSARPKSHTEPRRMAKGNHGDRPWTGIRSAKVRKKAGKCLPAYTILCAKCH